MLDAEAAEAGDRDDTAAGFQHRVMVTAIDPYADPNAGSGELNEVDDDDNSGTVTITITVKNVNEAPMITGGAYQDEAHGEPRGRP